MADQRCRCGRTTPCGLCTILAWPPETTGFHPTAEQQAAIDAYMDAEEGEATEAAYTQMVAAGLPAWGNDLNG